MSKTLSKGGKSSSDRYSIYVSKDNVHQAKNAKDYVGQADKDYVNLSIRVSKDLSPTGIVYLNRVNKSWLKETKDGYRLDYNSQYDDKEISIKVPNGMKDDKNNRIIETKTITQRELYESYKKQHDEWQKEKAEKAKKSLHKDENTDEESFDEKKNDKKPEPKKKDEEYEVVDDEKEDLIEKYYKILLKYYGIDGDFGHTKEYPQPLNVELQDAEGMNDRYHNYFKDVEQKLAGAHADGNYTTIDYSEAQFEARGKVRDMTDPADKLITERANHQCNINDELFKNGCGMHECSFTDKQGNPITLDWENDYQRSYDAVVYGLDHGMIDCTMKNGKKFEMPNDGYDVAAMDKASVTMEKYMSDLENRTHAELEKNPYVPEYVKDSELAEKYKDESKQHVLDEKARYDEYVKSYEAGKNPHLEMLQSHGMATSALSQNKSVQAVLAKADAMGIEDKQAEEQFV